MIEVVTVIVESLITAGVLLALFFGFKYWIDKGGIDKMLTKTNEDLCSRNAKLKKEIKALKQINEAYQTLLKMRETELAELAAENKEEKKESEDGEGV